MASSLAIAASAGSGSSIVEGGRRAVYEQPRRLDARGQVGEPVGDRLVLSSGLPNVWRWSA